MGYRRYPKETSFTDITLAYRAGDSFYMTTDGLIDQIGGPRGRSFGKNRFQKLLKKYQGHSMQIQAEAVRTTTRSSPARKASRWFISNPVSKASGWS